MSLSVVRTRTLAPLAAAVTLAIGLAVASAPDVLAECDGPVPSFREHAASADRVVIGDVTRVDLRSRWRNDQGGSSRFTLRVRYALRGPFERTMELRDLAYLPCSDHNLIVRKGDRIALALGASGFRPRIDFDTAAWIRGTPYPFSERITVAEAFALLGLRPPDSSTEVVTPKAATPWTGFAAILAGLVVGAAVYRRTKHRSRASGPAQGGSGE
jgi:hypothetical protein